VVLAGPWTLWRLSYYGYLVPNALAAKAGQTLDEQLEQGWRYLGGFAVAAQALLLVVPIAWLGLIVRWRLVPKGAGSTVWLLFVLALCYGAFFTITGGDWMPAWRFFAPAMPLLAAGLAATWVLTRPREHERGTESAPPGSRGGPLLAAVLSVLLLVVSVNHGNVKDRLDQWRAELYQMASLGAWINRTMPAGTVIATYANGVLSYMAGPQVTVVDVLGLTDEHIARRGKRLRGAVVGHAAYDYGYVVNVRKPDLVFMRGNGLATAPACDFMPELREHYRGAVFRVAGQARWAPVFVRTERADELIAGLDADPGFDRAPCPP
jgi:arabinofuranosyltransferase